MWEKVSSRRHIPIKIFPFGSNTDEIMLYGTVDYVMKDERHVSLDWAARAHLVKEDDVVKMDFYQVYLVSGLSIIQVEKVTSEYANHLSRSVWKDAPHREQYLMCVCMHACSIQIQGEASTYCCY